MATTPPAPRVLVIGLDPYRVLGPWDPEPVADAIEAGIARFAEHGVGVETCLFGLDGSDDVAAVVAAALAARPWECVVVGGGLRTSDDQLDLFEQVLKPDPPPRSRRRDRLQHHPCRHLRRGRPPPRLNRRTGKCDCFARHGWLG
ncbi:hypothetical protein ACFWR9_23260 [Streptomyces sp. NPDC058534]|uniref:hypothetical protein n=1 Tax=Streptomyces sp. NPDC058534 TaxID=3346541 RepID=UPI00365721BF